MAWTSRLVVLCLLAVASAQRQAPLPRNRGQNGNAQRGDADADVDADVINGDEIPGIAGVDYPVLAQAPRTDFTCDLLNVPGYYADQQTGCQVYYRCHNGGRGVASLCPNGTVFNQKALVCDWWYNVDCSRAIDDYKVNAEIVLEMAAIDAQNANVRRTTLSPLASRIPSLATLASRLRNPAVVNPFDRRLGAQSPFSGANPFAAPARYNGARDNENSSSDATQRYNSSQRNKDSAKGKNSDDKSDKEFDGYNYPNPNGIDRSYLPPSK